MSYRLAWHTSFRRALKKAVISRPALKDKIFHSLDRLAEDPFHPMLKTHKLHGQLEGLWAIYVEYDCRLIFTFDKDAGGKINFIVLVDIGKHDEVY